ncbi:hypothetical protein [uncultured Rummeliibacillus sp.]|uniref:hypothetical protein n=1 Tax=uncultured Rummeliibacillus sp. TaxID=762292 RepID=UPI00261A0D9C|nr:hypothetical protein [uncultured Rummeliibacillus sp.]
MVKIERKSRYTKLSFICLGVSILTFLITYLLGSYTSTATYSSPFSNTVLSAIFGYTLFAIVILAPIIGVIFGFKGNKGVLKITAIIANTGAFLTLSLLVGAMAVYDVFNDL